MIVCDSSGVLAALDRSERRHVDARAALESSREPLLLSPFVCAEIDYLLADRYGTEVELDFLHEVAAGAYRLEPFDAGDMELAASVVEQYRDLGVGLADASVTVLAARHRTTRILTLDARHFRAMRPLHGREFELLPG